MTEDRSDRAEGLQAMLAGDPGASARAVEIRRQAEVLVAGLANDEVAMLRHIVAGWSKAESAAELGLELHQLDKRRAGLLAKINASSTTDAVRVGIYAGLD